MARRLQQTGAAVYVHEGDRELAATAKAQGKNERSFLPYLGHPAAWRLLWELSGNGGLKPQLRSYNPLTGSRGPQLMPAAFTRSNEQALDSLARIEDVHADVILFGHGEPWTQGAQLAVERARSLGPT